MAERRAAGFNIPLNFCVGPEVESIPRRIRAAAIGVWALAGNYAATQLTDGYVGPEILKMFGCTDAIRAALKVTINKKGELSPLWVDARNGGVQLTNWPKHQRTSDEVTTYRANEAERKRDERAAKRNGSTTGNGKTSVRTSAGRPHNVRSDDRDPKAKTETETKTETNSGVTNGVSVQSVTTDSNEHTPLPEFCPNHPHGTPDPCGPCANIRKANRAREQAARDAAEQQADHQADTTTAFWNEVAACAGCDDKGWTETRAGVTRCPNHNWELINA